MDLWLLRHAKADTHAPSGRDQDRRLTPEGRSQCHGLHEWISQSGHHLPNDIRVSPALRAQETARTVLGHLPGSEPVDDPRLWEASVGELLSIIGEAQPATGLMLIAHNPGLEGLARWLGCRLPAQGMKPCTLCIIELSLPPSPGQGNTVAVYQHSESM